MLNYHSSMMHPPTPEDVQSALSKSLKLATERRHRQLIVLSGLESVCISYAQHLLSSTLLSHLPLWLGAGAPQGVPSVNHDAVNTVLGSEFSSVVINAFSGFECDSVAALEGTITAGGALVLITPALVGWPAFTDPALLRVSAYRNDSNASSPTYANTSLFSERFVRHIRLSTDIVIEHASCEIRVLRSLESIQPTNFKIPPTTSTAQPQWQEQLTAIDQLTAFIQQQVTHSLLLIADRGRGKSAALGIAAARILEDPEMRIVVSAPGRRSAFVLLQHLQLQLSAQPVPSVKNRYEFYPPDQLGELTGQRDLLIVDEAASIPLPLLVKAAMNFKHAMFASTVKGYEGAGRGFALRFSKLLNQHGLVHKQLTLEQPIRWAENDPLESFFNSTLLLDSPLNPIAVTPPSPRLTAPAIRVISGEELAQDENRLRTFFGLLLQAHYKTTPNDLRHILDSRNMRNFTLEVDGEILGAATIADEGPLHDLRLRQAVLEKRRRPSGHLLPQLLAQYTCSAAALDLRIARVVRIAIHPDCQRQGLGSEFLQALSAELSVDKFDAIGAMFSSVPETVRFWKKNGFIACHLGARKQTSSGYRAITMLLPQTKTAVELVSTAHSLYSDNQWFHRNRTQPDESPMMAAQHYDRFLLRRYCSQQRSFADSHTALARTAPLVIDRLRVSQSINSPDCQLFLQLQSPSVSIKQLEVAGQIQSKKAVENKLRTLLSWFFSLESA